MPRWQVFLLGTIQQFKIQSMARFKFKVLGSGMPENDVPYMCCCLLIQILRRTVERVSTEGLLSAEEGAYIIHHNAHFIAVRFAAGQCEVNFQNRTYTWQSACVRTSHSKLGWWFESGKWYLNPLRVATFRISPCPAGFGEEILDYASSDVFGGGVFPTSGGLMDDYEVAVVHSAMSGAAITEVRPDTEGSFVCKVRAEISLLLNVPFFSIAVLSDTGLIPEQMTWSELGSPRCVSIVTKQLTRHLTEDLFGAIEDGDPEGVRTLLLDGQDPTCMVVESALNIAVVRGHAAIVGVLLRGGAAVNLIPPGVPHAALHHAVIHGSILICQQLLQAKADPSLPDRRGCRPIHYALSGVTTSASAQIAEELLCWGADPMHRDVDDDTGFSMAVPGSLTALCLSSCWNRLAWIDLFQRHIEVIVEYGWAPALACTCASMRKQIPFISRLIGTDALMVEEEGDQFGGSGHHPFLPMCLFGASLVGWTPKLPADLLLLQYLFRHPGSMCPRARERIQVQLAEFYRAMNPYSYTLAKFPTLFWILPVPFEILESRVTWCYKLEVARIFFCLIKDGMSPQLECAMIAFFWPEIQEDPSLLEAVITSRTSLSRRDWIKKQVFALVCLHVLSSPSQHSVFHRRYVALFVALKTCPWSRRPSKAKAAQEKVLGIGVQDKKGGASRFSDFESQTPSTFFDAQEEADPLFLETVKQRIASMEAICCDFKVVLALHPRYWHMLPSPFAVEHDSQWQFEASSMRDKLSQAAAALTVDSHVPSEQCLNRIDKRMRVYIGVLRAFTAQLLRLPKHVVWTVNPCDAEVCKRIWEREMHLLRSRCRNFAVHRELLGNGGWESAGDCSDALGGSAKMQGEATMCKMVWEGEVCHQRQEKKARTSLVSPDHNRRIALNLRALRLEGRLVAPTTSQSRCPNFFCLRDFNLHTLLPLTLQEGFLQRSIMPQKPAAWPCNSPEVLDHLQLLHPHPRDQYLTFQADIHAYFWNGRRASLSATGLIHRFSHAFDPDSTLAQMRGGSNWPRPKYLKSYVPISLWLELQELGYTEDLMAMLSARRRSEVDICHLLRRLIHENPADAKIFLGLAKSDAQIKQQWALAADVGSSQGTWMHASFECLLNGGYVSTHDQEMDLFLSFLRQVEPLGAKVYRTEWTIYASKEDLAGSIDLVLQLPDQRLILVDWKRTQQISTKFNGFGKCMLGCLAALPDATLSHYRLQLNIYRYILEAYYGKQVAMMLVVGCHPDNGTSPFVENVPHLLEETEAVMKRLPFNEVDCAGGVSQTDSNADAMPIPSPWLQLLWHSMCPAISPELTNRVSLQLKIFRKQVRPVLAVLQAYPKLYFTLPWPHQTTHQMANWRFQLSSVCWFLKLLRDKRVRTLERTLFLFHQKVVEVHPFLGDFIVGLRDATSFDEWTRRMASCLLLLKVLSGEGSCRATLQHQKYALHEAKAHMCTPPKSCTMGPCLAMPLKISSFLQEPVDIAFCGAKTSKRTSASSLEPCYISVNNLVHETCRNVSAVSGGACTMGPCLAMPLKISSFLQEPVDIAFCCAKTSKRTSVASSLEPCYISVNHLVHETCRNVSAVSGDVVGGGMNDSQMTPEREEENFLDDLEREVAVEQDCAEVPAAATSCVAINYSQCSVSITVANPSACMSFGSWFNVYSAVALHKSVLKHDFFDCNSGPPYEVLVCLSVGRLRDSGRSKQSRQKLLLK